MLSISGDILGGLAKKRERECTALMPSLDTSCLLLVLLGHFEDNPAPDFD